MGIIAQNDVAPSQPNVTNGGAQQVDAHRATSLRLKSIDNVNGGSVDYGGRSARGALRRGRSYSVSYSPPLDRIDEHGGVTMVMID